MFGKDLIMQSQECNDINSSFQDLEKVDSLSDLILSRVDYADKIVGQVASVLSDAGVIEAVNKGREKTARYVVNMTEETIKAIDEGSIKLDQNKKGELFAQIRGANSQYGEKFSISRELTAQGVDPLTVAAALQLKAIQEQLMEMAEEIDAIGRDVKEVLQGQQNDRLGLYYSGESLINEARYIQDPSFKQLLTCQALKSLSDSSAQMEQQIKSDIRYLSEGKYKLMKSRQVEDVSSRMASINNCFEVIYRAALLKSKIYYEQGELPAMLEAINQYAGFLERTVVPNSLRLSEFDRSDNLLRGGKWEKRSALLSSVTDIKTQLAGGTTYYLCAPKEEGVMNER